jgi:membrane fusion protein (multidrug efflux system)
MAKPEGDEDSDRRAAEDDAARSRHSKTPDGAENSPDDEREGDEADAGPKKGLREHPLILAIGGTLLALAAVAGLVFWLHARNFESTDDAFVDAHIIRLAPQVAGRVTQVLVNDNQLVEANQTLVTIDSADSQTRVAQAEAQLAQAQAQVDNAKVQIDVSRAGYQQALAEAAATAAEADKAAEDLARYRALQNANPAAVAPQQLDQAVAAARQTAAQRDAAVKAAKAKAQQIKASQTQVASGTDQARAARSQLNEANINLGYAQIVAPVRGHVAQETVAVGNYAQPGTQFMAIVPLDVWITANFKETQLALMRAGQPVTIKVDACPNDRISGHVDSIQRGAGQAFALLPAENATGNFVKVVQRVPVKIVIDHPPPDCPLGPGMSVEPKVRVR